MNTIQAQDVHRPSSPLRKTRSDYASYPLRSSQESFGSGGPSFERSPMDSWVIQQHEEVKRQYDMYNQGAYQPLGQYIPAAGLTNPYYDPALNMRTSHFG